MDLNIEDYKYKGLIGISYIDIPRLVLDILKSDERYSSLVTEVNIPNISGIKKSAVSDIAGGILAGTVGIGWGSRTGGSIMLSGSPVKAVIFEEMDKGMGEYIRLIFQVPNGKYGSAKLEPKTKGYIRPTIIGADFNGKNVPGLEELRKNQDLMNEAFFVEKLPRLAFVRDSYSSFIIRFEKKSGVQYGIVESALFKDAMRPGSLEEKHNITFVQITSRLLDFMFTIALHVAAAAQGASVP